MSFFDALENMFTNPAVIIELNDSHPEIKQPVEIQQIDAKFEPQILVNNYEPLIEPESSVFEQRKAYHALIPIEAQRAFEHGFPWVQSHRQDLLDSGWTIPELFRRSKFKWPAGPWGLCWLTAWLKPNLSVSIHSTGKVIFTIRRGDRSFSQSANPQKCARLVEKGKTL